MPFRLPIAPGKRKSRTNSRQIPPKIEHTALDFGHSTGERILHPSVHFLFSTVLTHYLAETLGQAKNLLKLRLSLDELNHQLSIPLVGLVRCSQENPGDLRGGQVLALFMRLRGAHVGLLLLLFALVRHKERNQPIRSWVLLSDSFSP
jgi:hypothetical protein